jgi:hypothetical protein
MSAGKAKKGIILSQWDIQDLLIVGWRASHFTAKSIRAASASRAVAALSTRLDVGCHGFPVFVGDIAEGIAHHMDDAQLHPSLRKDRFIPNPSHITPITKRPTCRGEWHSPYPISGVAKSDFVSMASGKPVSPSTQAMKISFHPSSLEFRQD